MSDTLTLTRPAIAELIADGIREYETSKGAHANATGHVELGAVLRHFLDEQHISRTELADRSGVTANYVTKIILGDRMPSPTILARFANVLGESFLLDWYREIYLIDGASQGLEAQVHLIIGDRAILKKRYHQMVKDCMDGQRKANGTPNEAGCRKNTDALIRQYPEKYGIPLAGTE